MIATSSLFWFFLISADRFVTTPWPVPLVESARLDNPLVASSPILLTVFLMSSDFPWSSPLIVSIVFWPIPLTVLGISENWAWEFFLTFAIASAIDLDPFAFKSLLNCLTSLDTFLLSFLVWPGILLKLLLASLLANATASSNDIDPPDVKVLFILLTSLAISLFSFLVDFGILSKLLLAFLWDSFITSSKDIDPVFNVLSISFTSDAIALFSLSVASGILSKASTAVSFICLAAFFIGSWPLVTPCTSPVTI